MQGKITCKTSNFPKLMCFNDGETLCVILATDRSSIQDNLLSGVVVSCSDDTYPIGHYSEAWDMSLYSDFHGEVIITN